MSPTAVDEEHGPAGNGNWDSLMGKLPAIRQVLESKS